MFYIPRTRNSMLAWAYRITLFSIGLLVYGFGRRHLTEMLKHNPGADVTPGYYWWIVALGLLLITLVIGAVFMFVASFASLYGLLKSMQKRRAMAVKIGRIKKLAPIDLINKKSTWITDMDLPRPAT